MTQAQWERITGTALTGIVIVTVLMPLFLLGYALNWLLTVAAQAGSSPVVHPSREGCGK